MELVVELLSTSNSSSVQGCERVQLCRFKVNEGDKKYVMDVNVHHILDLYKEKEL